MPATVASARGESWSKWRLRVIVQFRQRIGLTVFVMLSGLFDMVTQQVTTPSRSVFIGVCAMIALLRLLISVVGLLVHNAMPRRVVLWGALDLRDALPCRYQG